MFYIIYSPGGRAVMDKELMPDWLAAHAPGRRPSVDDVLRARVVFYPGSGYDGSPVRFFGSRNLAHTFIYADYGVGRAGVERALVERSFRGYQQLDRVELTAVDLRVHKVRYHLAPDDIDRQSRFVVNSMKPRGAPFGFIEVLERTAAAGDAHGPARLAILFLYADGHAAYDGLFCQDWSIPPYAVVIQDHGFGGNYSSFGADGPSAPLSLVRRPAIATVALLRASSGHSRGARRYAWHAADALRAHRPSPVRRPADVQPQRDGARISPRVINRSLRRVVQRRSGVDRA
jgi:hypothetical protein